MRVSPSSPTTGSTQVMQTPMPQAIDSSTATWRGTPYDWATVGDRLQHRHRPAGVDDVGVDPLDHLGQHVGDPALLAERAVVGGDGDAGRHALGVELAEQPVLGRGAEHEVDPAAAVAQRLGQREQRRGAVAAADEDRGARARAAARTGGRAGRRRRSGRAAAGAASHAVPLPWTAKTNSTVPP